MRDFKRQCKNCENEWLIPGPWAHEAIPNISGARMSAAGDRLISQGLSLTGLGAGPSGAVSAQKVASLEAQRERVIANARCPECGSVQFRQYAPDGKGNWLLEKQGSTRAERSANAREVKTAVNKAKVAERQRQAQQRADFQRNREAAKRARARRKAEKESNRSEQAQAKVEAREAKSHSDQVAADIKAESEAAKAAAKEARREARALARTGQAITPEQEALIREVAPSTWVLYALFLVAWWALVVWWLVIAPLLCIVLPAYLATLVVPALRSYSPVMALTMAVMVAPLWPSRIPGGFRRALATEPTGRVESF